MEGIEAPIAELYSARNLREEAARHIQQRPAPTNASMIGPAADIIMIGGASIVVCFFYWMFVDSAASVANVAVFAYYLAFVINYPHFAASYQLLYGDYRKQILRKRSFFWAAVISPLLIAAAIVAAVAMASQDALAFLVQTMFLTVGWHYVKQIYGVSIVASAIQKRYFGTWQKNLILLNLYSVWAMSWVSANQATSKADLNGVFYYTLGLPQYLLTITYVATIFTLVLAMAVSLRTYIKTGVRPATSSMVGFASIYFWYLPALGHPLFFYVVPFFHSLQYMLFVFALKKNEAESASNLEFSGEAQRRVFVRKLFGFLAFAAAAGALGFVIIPRALDYLTPDQGALPYTGLWFFGIVLFINLHHYFIDNVIWRGDNEFLKTHLVVASQKRAAQ